MRYGLTAKMRELLDFIEAFIAQHNVSPSYDEMCLGLGYASKAGIHRLVKALEARGAIERIPDRARTIVPASYVSRTSVNIALSPEELAHLQRHAIAAGTDIQAAARSIVRDALARAAA